MDNVFNISLGRAVELYNRVSTNDPANSAIVIIAIETTATDLTLKRLDTLALVLADADTAEVTNTNYERKVLTDADITAFMPDDVNDTVELDLPDQTWIAVADGDSWSDLIIAYDPDVTGGTDADVVPMTLHDFVAVPNTGDVTAVFNAGHFYSAS
ncbi:MAG: hypothetical protein GY774_04975 [Planctomycetes bacterium]|nr:hypothetical protein [Planctomycetota bacterium]